MYGDLKVGCAKPLVGRGTDLVEEDKVHRVQHLAYLCSHTRVLAGDEYIDICIHGYIDTQKYRYIDT